MISVKKRIASAMLGAAVVSSMALGGQPTATALDVVGQGAHHDNKEVMMPYPLGGQHRMLYNLGTICSWPSGKGNEPVRQALGGYVTDLDADASGNFFSLHGFFPFNSVTVNWKNLDTNATGSKTTRSNGNKVNVENMETGKGKVEASMTVTRSLLPIIMEDFPLSSAWSATHTETFTFDAIDEQKCEAGPG